MSPESIRELQDMLIRIDERMKAVQEDLREINEHRRCHTHSEKIRTLERMVWGCATAIAGLALGMLRDVLR